METKFFLHRIQRKNGAFEKGVEVHDTLDSAILAYHGRMKLAGNPDTPNIDYVSCMITDGSGSVVRPFAETWKTDAIQGNVFFMHYCRNAAGAYTKGIDVCEAYDAAKQAYHAQMEYGYGNSKFPDMTFVSAQITDITGAILMSETWNLPEPEPVPPEPDPDPEPEA